jgi:hypothetical protein
MRTKRITKKIAQEFKTNMIPVHIRANRPRINAQCTSFSWFIFNLHTIDMYLFIFDSGEIH